METFEKYESKVRIYSRCFPVIFSKAKGSFMYDENNNEYIDFFSGAGTLNYGHNNPIIKKAIINYMEDDGIVHGLDMATSSKKIFLNCFNNIILKSRKLDYKIQFTGPTGTNAVEAALKLARKIKKRPNVIAFTGSFHGMTLGALSVTSNQFYKNINYCNNLYVNFMPFDGFFGKEFDTIKYLRKFLENLSYGIDLPAAIITEAIQCEGGVNISSNQWLQRLSKLCCEFDILLIIDDIQAGNGRSGKYFSFEDSGIKPDIITLSKALGGYGLPMSIVLIKPELDKWEHGEHTGTFRGNNLAFVAATEALNYWKDEKLCNEIQQKEQILSQYLFNIKNSINQLNIKVRGKGLIYGLELGYLSKKVAEEAFKNSLIIELSGQNKVIKFLPSLLIEQETLLKGLDILRESIISVIKNNNM